MKSSHKKFFRVAVFIVLAFLAFMLTASVAFSLFYENTAIRYLKKYLDEHLLTQLSVKNIRFKVLTGFPNATLAISNVVLLSGDDFAPGDFPGTMADTLLQAKRISFQFNMLKLLRKEFELKKVEISNGQVNIMIDRAHHHNLKIWKSGESNQSQISSVHFQGIALNEMRLNMISLSDQIEWIAFTDKTHFKGSISDKILSGETRGRMVIDSLTVKNKKLLGNTPLEYSAKLTCSGDAIRFSQGKIEVNKIYASVEGEYSGGKDKLIDLTVNVPRFKLAELVSLLPFSTQLSNGNYRFEGDGKLIAVISGPVANRKGIHVKSNFELKDCKIRNAMTKTEISHIDLKGEVKDNTNGNFQLQVDQLSSVLGKGFIKGSFELTDLQNLIFSADIQSLMDLEELKKFAPTDKLEEMSGFIHAGLNASGSLQGFTDSLSGFWHLLKNGTFSLDDVGMKIKGVPWNIEHARGLISWNKVIRIDSLSMLVNGNDLLINGSVQNLPEYLAHQKPLMPNLNISTGNLNLSNILNDNSRKSTTGSSTLNRLLPPQIELKAGIKAKNFTAGKFNATDVKFELNATGDSIYIQNYNLRFPDGSINGTAKIILDRDKKLTVTCNASPHNINIQQLLFSFNNFTQNFIVDKNVKGQLTGRVDFSAEWDSTLTFISNHLTAQADIEIDNGELIQFEPMMRLSKYINLDELRHIRFKTMKNVINIRNRMVSMPEMAIHSSAFNISVSGNHSFSHEFDYRLKVLLSEVLFKKARKKTKEMENFLSEETREDQTTIPLKIIGTPDNFDVCFDRKKAFDLTRNTIKAGDASGEKIATSANFRVEWDESDQNDINVTRLAGRKDTSDFIIDWNEDDNADF
jgi:hypothetical protein